MRGSGKTTIGKLLSKKLNRKVLELDNLIEEKVGEKISDYISKNGWVKFRNLESEILSNAANSENSVISCGGGVVERPINIINLKRNGFLIYLAATIDTLYKRIGEDNARPLLTETNSMKTDLENIFQKRKDLYKKAADLIISVDNKSIDEICQEIIKALEK